MTRPVGREAHDRGDCDLWTCRYCDAENRATWTPVPEMTEERIAKFQAARPTMRPIPDRRPDTEEES